MVNIEIEGPSTSIGPSELVPPDTSRELGSSPVEVIRYQPAQVEYHDIPTSPESGGPSGTSLSSSPPLTLGGSGGGSGSGSSKEDEEDEEELDGEQGERVGLVSGKDRSELAAGKQAAAVVGTESSKPCCVAESAASSSSESEANELQSLMQHASPRSPSGGASEQQASAFVNLDTVGATESTS